MGKGRKSVQIVEDMNLIRRNYKMNIKQILQDYWKMFKFFASIGGFTGLLYLVAKLLKGC
tara:strand:+ start:325 stop:504 length:180 start_codon:yes stop_codon:yes gene_type:complete